MIKLSVSIFGQTTGYRIKTMSREPIQLPEIQYPVFSKLNNTKYTFHDIYRKLFLLVSYIFSVTGKVNTSLLITLRFKINGERHLFFYDFCGPTNPPPPPPQLILTPMFVNFSNFMSDYKNHRRLMFGYCKQLLNILEIPMLSEVYSV